MIKLTTDELVSTKPVFVRVMFSCFSAALAVIGGTNVYAVLFAPEHVRKLHNFYPGYFPAFLVGGLMVLGLSSVCLYMAYPSRLRIDITQGTYRYTYGVLFWKRIRTGPVEAFSRVSMKSYGRGINKEYAIKLFWKHPLRIDAQMGQPFLFIGKAKHRQEAEEMLEQLSKVLRLPAY